MPITKHNFIVKDVKRSGGDHKKGICDREEGPPRPGTDRYPSDVTANKAEYKKEAIKPSSSLPKTSAKTTSRRH